MSYLLPILHLKPSEKRGLGVFTTIDLEENTLIEISPVIVLSEKDTELIHQTHLHDYYFSWGDSQKKSAIGLGYISVYNHAEKANCFYECDFENNCISVFTKFAIKANQELFINYNMDEEIELWFDVV